MIDCKATSTPFILGVKLEEKCSTPLVDATLYRHMVGILIYLTHESPNISFAVGMVSRFMQEPHELHLEGRQTHPTLYLGYTYIWNMLCSLY